MVPSVVNPVQMTCSKDTPHHLQLVSVSADTEEVSRETVSDIFKRHSVSTINSVLVFNGNLCQVRKGQSWIKMHHYFSQSVTYTMC